MVWAEEGREWSGQRRENGQGREETGGGGGGRRQTYNNTASHVNTVNNEHPSTTVDVSFSCFTADITVDTGHTRDTEHRHRTRGTGDRRHKTEAAVTR